ncbi:carbamate kinase [Mesobacterium pallidum]|uniref:carbamate kinase n=1 Tax=Mesobacterium pallidum TaxID=2872037 RepID=UPI001EE1F1FD|nr:carbamate kinase [Mesobacterium pallidum]
MKLLVALGGNALLQRGEPLSTETQLTHAREAARVLESAAREHQLILTHGNGPQVGLLAMQAQAFAGAVPYAFDMMTAATEGMIGYMLEQELGNRLGYDVPVATILTRVEVDPDDPEFLAPSKFVGPGFDAAEAERLRAAHGWTFRQDGSAWRRVVPSPQPRRVLWHRPIRWLLEQGSVVICSGGGGIPVAEDGTGGMRGVDSVIDKDRASSLLATRIPVDLFVIATDVPGVYADYGTPEQRLISELPAEADDDYARGSMGPKVEAARAFARATGKPAVIGALDQIDAIIAGRAGTRIVPGGPCAA